MFTKVSIIGGFTLMLLASQPCFGRSVYLNGTDISSAANQTLKKVDIKISENGDIFIHAPHYQVSEENTYSPLSKAFPSVDHPKHKSPEETKASSKKDGAQENQDLESPAGTEADIK